MVEEPRRGVLRSPADGCLRHPRRHHDRRGHRVRRPPGIDPARAADELRDLSLRRDPVRRRAGGGDQCHPAQRDAAGLGRNADRHARCAASGCLQLRAVLSRKSAGNRSRRLVARGRRSRRRGAVVEIHRDVLWPGDPDLARDRAETAALVSLALALSRWPRCARAVLAGDPLECGPSMGLVRKAARPRQDRGLSAGLYRRADPDPDRVRNSARLHPRRNGAARADLAPRRRAGLARADRDDVLDRRRLFRLAFAACPRRGQLVRAGLSALRYRGGRRRQSRAVEAAPAAPGGFLPALGCARGHRDVCRADRAGQHRLAVPLSPRCDRAQRRRRLARACRGDRSRARPQWRDLRACA
ncbi:hypothetical protein ACVWWP_003788 [Bradyrhizobium sp. LM3.6]